jgi:ferredoxin/flavodoxin
MENRRKFIKRLVIGCAGGCAALAAPGMVHHVIADKEQNPIVNLNPNRALVVWFSQTGHTERVGRCIQHTWQTAGLTVDAMDYRHLDSSTLDQYDLIAVGTAVNYMDVPVNVQDWIKTLPSIDGISLAAFVTFGGHGDGQHNTACHLMELMEEKGGACAGIATFGNMSTFAPTWSMGNEERTLAYKHLPDEETYQLVQAYAQTVLDNIHSGGTYPVERQFGMDSLIGVYPQMWFTKQMITNHHIDTGLCIQCEICQEKCTVGAIQVSSAQIDIGLCIACLGCVNNCPTKAMKMNFLTYPVYGFNHFLKEHSIEIMEPPEADQ